MRDSKCDLLIKPRVSNHISKCEFKSATSLEAKASSIISSCRICLSSLLDPAVLTCGHRFCEKCLNQYWRIRDKPDYIVCPLCRACAFNVDFAKKEERASTEDFRKMFTEMSNISDYNMNNAIILCLKLSVLMPAFYWVAKWLKMPLLDLFTNIHHKLISKP
ncbi:LON peptidase N-terminal domain and RING finger protein 3-like [Spodoptera frugiperda]|uniref:LON peptidase N-terminal domain and RING finger protein 3-like n=1 Tax=Spodoptera frugiperda TaxID=7108 RepID=A0A9R0EIA6_SPOFR|nr:LON peptidase N-terminal domain and RING finger protein 3-like [Spodoptera frugiperda]